MVILDFHIDSMNDVLTLPALEQWLVFSLVDTWEKWNDLPGLHNLEHKVAFNEGGIVKSNPIS